MKNLFSWFNSYLFIRWIVFLFVIGSIIFLLISVSIVSFFEELNIEFSDNYLYGLLLPIYFFIIKYLLNQKYNYANLDKISRKFKNAVLFIYGSIILTAIIFLIILKIKVLAFFAGPFFLLSFIMLVYGCDSIRNELKLLSCVKEESLRDPTFL